LLYGLIEQYRLNTYLIEKSIINLEGGLYKNMLEDFQKIEDGNLCDNDIPDVVKENKIECDDIN
jgi:hypothetical protein